MRQHVASDESAGAGADKQRIAVQSDANRERTRMAEQKATKEASTDREDRDAKRMAKGADDEEQDQPSEHDHAAAATKVAHAPEDAGMRNWAVKGETLAVADAAKHPGGENEGGLDPADGRDGADRRISVRSGADKTRAGHTDTNPETVGRGNKKETAHNRASKTARTGTAKSDEVHVDDDATSRLVHAEGGEDSAVDPDGAMKAEKEDATGKAGVSVDQQTVSGIASKNGAIGGERADAKANRLIERSGRVRMKGDKAGRTGETRGEVKSGEPADGGDKTRKRIVADIEVNLREESDRDGALKGDTTLPDAGDRRSGAAETDSSSFLTRLEHAPNTPTQRQGTAQQAAGTLARRLNGDLGTNIVRQAKVMLKEADQAEIRLIIRPPELGRVRINMHMENGHIAGRILVDNGSVREAVEQNLAALQRAFEEAGLEVGDFEVSTGDSRDEAADDRATASRSGANRRSNGAGQFADSVEPIVVNDYSHRRINLVA